MRRLTVRGRYLAWEDGEPFFYLGDTAWEIFHRLNREEAAWYMAQRARQGFTAVQGVALAEMEGLTVPNAYGRLPLLLTDGVPDPAKPDTQAGYSYWDHVDYIVEEAGRNGIFIALLPTWGDKYNLRWGKGPEIFTKENAYLYGKWIADRYRDRENIIWMLGGDVRGSVCPDVFRRIGRTLKQEAPRCDRRHGGGHPGSGREPPDHLPSARDEEIHGFP